MRWLEMLKSNTELVEVSGESLEAIRTKAGEILAPLAPSSDPDSSPPKTKKGLGKKRKKLPASSNRSLFNTLFQTYRETEDILTRCAISYLLKNGCQVSDREEDPEKFASRRREVEIEIERLTEQLANRIPKGRDLTNAKWLDTLAIATTTIPQDEAQAKRWQNTLLTQPTTLPFPVVYETNEDLGWSKNEKNCEKCGLVWLWEHSFAF